MNMTVSAHVRPETPILAQRTGVSIGLRGSVVDIYAEADDLERLAAECLAVADLLRALDAEAEGPSDTTVDVECDICGKTYPVEDMATLGGDRYSEGDAPAAFPAECNDCQDARYNEVGR